MEKFNKLSGHAIPLRITNVDTDMIIPKQFLKTIKRTGLGEFLFYELRYDQDGNKISSFALNQEQYKDASILIAGKNFGCGSSREHAPWSIADYGIKCIIAPSYADIFYNNCFKNGILPITVSADERDALMADARDIENPELAVDLVAQTITRPNGPVISFEIDAFRKQCLLDGLDDIGLTLAKDDAIASYEQTRKTTHPWL